MTKNDFWFHIITGFLVTRFKDNFRSSEHFFMQKCFDGPYYSTVFIVREYWNSLYLSY